jgi:hypothetical protein
MPVALRSGDARVDVIQGRLSGKIRRDVEKDRERRWLIRKR